MKKQTFWIEHIEKEIEKSIALLPAAPPELYEPIRYILSMKGKRMRPLLVLLGCDLFDGKTEDAISASIAIELFHNFTLVHDDIMDNAPLRRNQKTVHQKWDANTAILSGDTMLVEAYKQISKTKNLSKVISVFSETALKVCEGQAFDMHYEKQDIIPISHYFKMIELKTAVLLAGSLKIGAVIGNANDEDANHLYEFGKNIGIAFQLQDDILDVYGGEKFGKQRGGDIISNKKTFLLLKAMELTQMKKCKQVELSQWMHTPNLKPEEKVGAVSAIYDFLNVREIAEQEIKNYFARGMCFLDEINADEQKKTELKQFANNLLVREI